MYKQLGSLVLIALLSACDSNAALSEAQANHEQTAAENNVEAITVDADNIDNISEQKVLENIEQSPQQVADKASDNADPQSIALKETRFDDWFKVCPEQESAGLCRVMQTMEMQTEQGSVRLLQTVLAPTADNKMIMEMTLPLGLDMRPGIVIQIGDLPEFKQSYLTCAQSGCLVITELTEERLSALKKSMQAKVGFKSLNSDQTIVLELSLKGISKALASLQSSSFER